MEGVQVFVYVPKGASHNASDHCCGVSLVGGVPILAGVTRSCLCRVAVLRAPLLYAVQVGTRL